MEIAAVDLQYAFRVDRDKDAGFGHGPGGIDGRFGFEFGQAKLDGGEAFRPGGVEVVFVEFELAIFVEKSVVFLLLGISEGGALRLEQNVAAFVVPGEGERAIDPFPSLGFQRFGCGAELVGDKALQ